MEYLKLIRKPDISMLAGIKVTKETELEFENEIVKQTLKDLKLHTIMTVEGEGYTSTYDTTIELNEGEVLIFEEDSRGYVKPVEEFMTVGEAIEELEYIKEV